MPNIDDKLALIMSAVYGQTVRSAIHDAIDLINQEVDGFLRGELDTDLKSTTLPAEGKATGDAIRDIGDAVFTSDDYIPLSGKFEFGDLYVDNEGNGEYFDSKRRVRTAANHPLTLRKGDVITLTDKTDRVFRVYKKNLNGKYTSCYSGFVSTDFTINESGEYEIVARYPTEATISDVESFKSKFCIKRFHVSDEQTTLTELVDTVYDSTELSYTSRSSGWRLNAGDGTSYQNSSYKITKYAVAAGDILKVVTDDSFQFQNNQSIPSDVNSYRIGKTYGSGTFLVEVPTGATYLMVSSTTNAPGGAYSIKDKIEGLHESFNYLSDAAFEEFPKIKLFAKFELGDLYVDNEGNGEYLVSARRIRTVQNHPIYLYQGDVVSVNNVNLTVFHLYKKESNGKYTSPFSGFISTDYTIGADGEYEIVARYPTEAYITDVDSVKANLFLTRASSSETVVDHTTEINDLNSRMEKLYDMSGMFELGDLYVDNSGNGSYYTSQRRIRTIHNHPIRLLKGDIITLTDPTAAVFHVYKKESNGTYTTSVAGFNSTDFPVGADGEYEIVARYPTEATISDVESFKSKFCLKRAITLNGLYDDTNDNLNDLRSFVNGDNSLFKYLEYGDLYVDSSGTGTYHSSQRRIRTVQDHPISLHKGDIVYSTNNNNVFHIYKKTNGLYTSPVSGFISSEQLIDKTGEYEIVARYQTESQIIDFKEIAESIRLRRTDTVSIHNVNLLSTEDIYREELEATVNTVRNRSTSRGYLMGLIADTHVNKVNAGYYDQTIENLKRLHHRLNFNGIVHLGDIVNGFQESKEEVEYHLEYAMNKLLTIDPLHTYVAIGNHDNNHFSGDIEMIPDSEMYGITQRYNEMSVVRSLDCSDSVNEKRSSNLYYDYDNLKIRFIVFDSSYANTGFSEEMIQWMRSVFVGAPSDYKFVLLTHCGITIDLNGNYGIANRELLVALLQEYSSRIYCYICGHAHCDFVSYPYGFAQIALDCAVPNQPATVAPEGADIPERVIGTVTQDCITILNFLPSEQKVELIRFGAGSDRTIPFRQ